MKSFSEYLEERIWFVLYNIAITSFFVLLFFFLEAIWLAVAVFVFWILCFTIYLWWSYRSEKKKAQYIIELSDQLEETYLISELLPSSKRLLDDAYLYALKKACKAMNDSLYLTQLEKEQYKHYIEMWIHEIKTPIAALSLLAINEENENLKEELTKMNRAVEQILFYARSKDVAKDYFISKQNLGDMVHRSILDFQKVLRKQNVTLDLRNLEFDVYTDEKWTHFIINQMLQNSLQYFNKVEKKLTISASSQGNAIILSFRDNGIGIKKEDLGRIFEYGFTGQNRKKEHSTGMGLYICKQLALKLGLDIIADSEENKYTEFRITFPKTQYLKMEE